LNGGIDYDLSTALAELIDNAIAALVPNYTSKERQEVISVELSPSKWRQDGTAEGPLLKVRDTGKGMNLHELRAWATLGDVSPSATSDKPVSSLLGPVVDHDDGNKPTTYSSSSTATGGVAAAGGEKYLLGSLGRYGVGGKHAAFQLASSVTVATRQRGAPFVFEATLDAQLLSGEGGDRDKASSSSTTRTNHYRYNSNKGGRGGNKHMYNHTGNNVGGKLSNKQHRWVAELRVRAATPEEVSFSLDHPSWTILELRKLKSGFVGLVDTTVNNNGEVVHVGSGGGGERGLAVGRRDNESRYQWSESGVVQRSLSNLFYFYLFPDPLPLFHTEGFDSNSRSTSIAKRKIRPYLLDGYNDHGEHDKESSNNREHGDDDDNDHTTNRKPRENNLLLPQGVVEEGNRVQKGCLFNLKLFVDGSLLLPSSSDFATMWQAAGTEMRFELKVQPEGSPPAFATL
jgi:hypothetical protein